MPTDPCLPAAGQAPRRIAWWCAPLMLVVVIASAYLRHHGASAELQTAWAEQIAAARLAHRVAATLVLLAAIAMLVLARRAHDVAASRMAAALVGVALLLSLLGLAAGASREPVVVVVNLLGGFVMLALCVRLAKAPLREGLGGAAWGLLALLALQAAVGAVAGSQASPDCVWLSQCGVFALIHRAAGIVLAPALMVFGLWAIWYRQQPLGPTLAILAGMLMLVGLLSAALVAASAPPWLPVVHNALSALTLACLARMA